MVISYDNRKKSYDSMDDSQKQQYNDMLKNKGDDYIGNQYMQQRKQEAKPMNPEKAIDTTQKAYKWNPWQLDQKVETTKDANGYSQTPDWFYTWNSEWEKAENRKKLREIWEEPLTEEE